MRQIELAEIDGKLSKYLHQGKADEVVIAVDGKAAGYLHVFADADEAEEYRLINDPRFIRRVAEARASARAGRLFSSEDVDQMLKSEVKPGRRFRKVKNR